MNPATLPNLRDLGGLPTESGGRTRSGVLLRSAAPLPDDRDPDGVPTWPPTEVIDLRSTSELRGRPHPLARPGTRVHVLPMLVDRPTRTRDWSDLPDLPTFYPELLATGAATLVEVLRLTSRAGGPVLLHCAAGKDRTGIAVAVLLRAAGVTREAILADYLETARHVEAVFARDIGYLGPDDPTLRERLMGTPPEAIDTVLDELDRAGRTAPDPAGAWLLRHGASTDDLTAWRARLLGPWRPRQQRQRRRRRPG